jgi:hypothetical protein
VPTPAAVLGRLRERSRALGALSAQFSQAAGSLLIGVLSARLMERFDFATISLILGQVVVATGISTGLVGDSLTVLDRHDPQIRTALRHVLGALLLVAGVVAAGASVLTRQLEWGPAALFGLLLAAWLAEDVVRRLLMANLRFWPIVVVDLTHLVVSSSTVLVGYLTGGRQASVGLFLAALTAGQVAAGAVGVALMPRAERYWGRRLGGGLRTVLDFGLSRSVQGSLRPAVLLVLRVVVIFVAGKGVYATLEAARLYVAPALLAVNGVGSFLLSTFASAKGALPRRALRRADLAATALLACSAAFTLVSWALATWAPTLLSSKVPVTPLAVVAWGVYTGCVAVTMPYGSLAAVRGRHHGPADPARRLGGIAGDPYRAVVERPGERGPGPGAGGSGLPRGCAVAAPAGEQDRGGAGQAQRPAGAPAPGPPRPRPQVEAAGTCAGAYVSPRSPLEPARAAPPPPGHPETGHRPRGRRPAGPSARR